MIIKYPTHWAREVSGENVVINPLPTAETTAEKTTHGI